MKYGFDEWWRWVLDAAKRIRPRREPADMIILDELHRYRGPVDPNLKVYDPASGSPGFLLHADRAMVASPSGPPSEQTVSSQERLKVRNAQDKAVQRMMRTAQKTAIASLRERILRLFKPKPLDMEAAELAQYIAELLVTQNGRCKLSGLFLQWDEMHTDAELLCSLDRIDSSKGYVRGNLQIVCRFINRWKGSSDNDNFLRLLDLVRTSENVETRPRDNRRFHRL